MANVKTSRNSKGKKTNSNPSRSLARRIEGIDRKMQAALEKGDFTVAKQLADEQERLLEHLMLFRETS